MNVTIKKMGSRWFLIDTATGKRAKDAEGNTLPRCSSKSVALARARFINAGGVL